MTATREQQPAAADPARSSLCAARSGGGADPRFDEGPAAALLRWQLDLWTRLLEE